MNPEPVKSWIILYLKTLGWLGLKAVTGKLGISCFFYLLKREKTTRYICLKHVLLIIL